MPRRLVTVVVGLVLLLVGWRRWRDGQEEQELRSHGLNLLDD
jgi:hypothetical protein